MKALFNIVVGLLLSLYITGCATSSVMVSYTSQTNSIKEAIEDEYSLDDAYEKLSKKVDCADKILYLQERGRVASLMGETEWSNEDYTAAANAIEQARMKADLSASDTAASAVSLITNDNAIPYKGFSYEKTFLHTFQAFNYLEQKDLEGALVEVRKATNEQTFALHLHEKEVRKAHQEAQDSGIDLGYENEALGDSFKKMSRSTGRVKNSFQNAYTFYLSGVLYEASGDPDNAKIAYSKAYELYPDNVFLKNATQMPQSKEGSGRLVVLYEDGFVPEKHDITIPFFYNGLHFLDDSTRSYTVSMPFYDSHEYCPVPLKIFSSSNKYITKTQPVCNVCALATKALVEDYPKIFIRQILRLITKDQMQRQLGNQSPGLGLIAAIASYATERADLRSWLTLPNNVQIADVRLPQGTHTLEFDYESVSVPVSESKITILRIVRAYDKFYTTVLTP